MCNLNKFFYIYKIAPYWLFVYFWRSKFEVQLFLKFENYPANSWLLFAALYAD
jgi:hypothetical protein